MSRWEDTKGMTETEEMQPQATADTLRPFYFYVVAWGEQFRGYLAELCLPSLLSPNNIPALSNRATSRILICTTREDWEALRAAPIFPLLVRHIEPVWIEMPLPEPDDSKMMVMSRGQKECLEMAFRDRAYGIVLAPDLVLSDGSVAELQRLALEGKKLVLSVALRFSMDPIVAAFRSRGLMRPGEALTLQPRELMQIALPNLHSEIRRFEWDAPYFSEFPISCYWRVPDGSGIVVHSFSWAPMLLDFGSLKEHRSETLDNWTLDGDYVHLNFPGSRPTDDDVHVVTDSDRLAFVSMTSESDLTFYPLEGHWTKSLPVVGTWTKSYLLNKAYHEPVFDDLKRELFVIPVKLHSGELSNSWGKIENDAKVIFAKCIGYGDEHGSIYSSDIEHNISDTRYYLINTKIPRFSFWRLYAIFGRILYESTMYFSGRLRYATLRRRATRLMSYLRVIWAALLGNQAERARIERRVTLIRSKYGSLRRFVFFLMLLPFAKIARLISLIRSRLGRPSIIIDPQAPSSRGHGYFVIRIRIDTVERLGAAIKKIWEVLVCFPRLTWTRIAPYLRVIALAARGGRAEQARIRRRLGIVVSRLGARIR